MAYTSGSTRYTSNQFDGTDTRWSEAYAERGSLAHHAGRSVGSCAMSDVANAERRAHAALTSTAVIGLLDSVADLLRLVETVILAVRTDRARRYSHAQLHRSRPR